MRTLRLKISDLYTFQSEPAPATPDLTSITQLILRQFAFLPQPVAIQVEGDEVVLSFPEESKAAQVEAARLAERAAKRAAEGSYEKAIEVLKRVLQLQPSLLSARRDLAMVYVETGDVENATNHLIDVLRVDPKDAWSLVVLANLYIREKSNLEIGEKLLRRSLEIKPDDPWALNSLAALAHQRGVTDEAVALFDRSIAANPNFPNPYFGKASALGAAGHFDGAVEALSQLFGRAKMQDARSQSVFDNARQLHARLQEDLAKRHQSDAFKSIQNYKVEMEALSGFSVRIEEGDFKDKVGARIQMAWKHGRDYHLITTRRGYAPDLLSHLEAHELTHLRLESEARKVGKNLFFATTARSRETSFRAISGDLRKWQNEGYSADSIQQVTASLTAGLCGFLFNCPIDMLIERHIRETFPALRPAQFLSVRLMAEEAWQTNENRDVRRLTPRKIMQASLTLNGVYALFLDDLFAGASAFAAPYRRLETFAGSQELLKLWSDRAKNLGPGDEYKLVDEFADALGMNDWYEWKPDPGQHEVTAAPRKEGTTNPTLLQQKHPAAVFHLLSALERYDNLPIEKVREIAFEIGIVGQTGLDYADPEPKYSLRSLPGEKFSGLQLMCLMYAGFKRIAPELDSGMDLHEPFLTALELFEKKNPKGE